ncbi:hypothetical protein MSG28_011729 [Choristoneura fumiferana]|uniref:Uncharacterized protein n=2 Tax=Choristoneura fumiferana TaxID=7141 RepID=A0ACC0KLT6_CHOFU|nr:hypothetical protein MSG28_011729 [Choristoneura fumiferana]
MQDIVYKLVPDLQDNELKRERDFYRVRGLPCPKDAALATDKSGTGEEPEQPDNTDSHRKDEQVNVCLECISTSLRTLKRSFIRCSAQATITHLKKFVAKKVLNGMEKYREIDILCNDELLGKDHTLKFVYVTRWRFRDPPLRLQYRPKIDL